MKSEDLGLPIFYQDYPEYFDTPENIYSTQEKNEAIEKLLHACEAKTVLDLACGTGAQVFHLASLGYDVVGADFSPGLIKIAKEKAEQKNISCQFLDGDMRNLQVEQFDAVITIDNAIGHLVEGDFKLAINNIHHNLKHEGVYIFDILNLDAMTDDVLKSDNERMTDKRAMNDGAVIRNLRHSTINRKKGHLTSENNFTIEKNGAKKEIKNTCTLQIYTMSQLTEILESNGFKVLEQFAVDAYTFKKDESGYSILTVAKQKTWKKKKVKYI